MSRHYSLLLALCAASVGVLLIFSFSFTALLAATLGFLAGYFLLKVRHVNQVGMSSLPPQNVPGSSDSRSTEIFALGKLFEATLDEMREGLLVVDNNLRVVASNPAAHRLFNLVTGRLESQRLTEITRNPAIYSAFHDALKGNERSGVEIETHDPSRRVFDLRVVPLGSSDGTTTAGAIGVFFDITQLEKLERVRQEFLSNVSHELRTPLTAILAFVETLEAGALDDRENSERFLAIIRKNAARMQNLIDDILELSAIEAGNVGVKAEEIELRPLINDVIMSLTAKASSRGITLLNDVSPDTIVFVDPRRLEQMLNNLVDNAIKFNRDGGMVTIGCEAGTRTRILVRDTGEGIPAQHLERLFERFYRVDRARSRDMGGTGLGLAIVKHLARAHGGEVRVSSELGQGSTFEIDLPQANGISAAPEAAIKRETIATPGY
ncbi:MAG: PAS domain-containing protein [Pyrinomonadaceae bacterium]|nr:PAS domain-containing protein [Pyrinomonadaceae bacterium]